ncbi:MAG: NAD(P)H-dependent oxidoreductase [Bacteroidales bacterium]|jgi:chromate reductase|nr:NAD(P)H-dependent oxidoreductase [Bacteroidales bacterium]HPC99720.1 NADPH-dependent FMN reductase [Acetivibrio sp.]
MRQIKISAIVGSLRKESYNRQLALAAKEILKDRADFTLLEYQDIPLMNQDIEFPAPEAVKRVREEVKSADGIWFFTPEYNHFFPGVLKNLIDWLSRPISNQEPQVLGGKPAAISGISPGMSGTGIAQDHLVTLISYLNMEVMNTPRLTIPNAMQQLDSDGRLALKESYPFLEMQANAFLNFVQKRMNDSLSRQA